jgi:two-component system, NtrC family, sensor histidine kinase HydH
MVASTLAQDVRTAESVSAASPVQSDMSSPLREQLLPLGYYLVVVIVLASTSYPTWRIATLAVAALVPGVTFYLWSCAPGARRQYSKQCLNADAEQVAWCAVLSQTSLFVTTGIAAALTGGVRSPLLPTMIAAYFGAAALVGDRVQSRLLLGVTGLGVGVLGVLPRPWTGPELTGSVFTVLLVVSVLGVGALLAPIHARARRWRADFARAREEMASEALTRAQSLEQIGSKLAHELKNPLTGVKALVQLGLRNPDEASSHERLEVVENEVTRMQEILENYLSFTRPLQEVTPARVDLGSLILDTLVALSARADEARVRLYAQGDASLEADPRRLKEALLNLVANAIEATPPGGEVVVEVRPAGDDAEIVIRDTGRGMAPEILKRIGTPFFTTRDEGTGLGVVLARSVIAQHGGSLRYESEPGKGTNARVKLPRVSRGIGDATCTPGG